MQPPAESGSKSASHGAPRSRRRVLLGAALAPWVIHAVACGVTWAAPDLWDFIVAGGALVYAALVLVLYARRATQLGRLAALVVSASLSMVLLECVLAAVRPATPALSPMPPGVRRSTASSAIPGVEGEIVFTVNELGLRGPPGAKLDPAALRILCIGGSTTQCVYNTDARSWPWRLQELLTQGLDEPVYVGNAGKSGDITPHHAFLAEHYPHAERFEWAVLLCGVNDLGALVRANYQQRAANASETLAADPRQGFYYRRSATLRMLREFGGPLRAWMQTGVAVQDAEGQWYQERRRMRRERLAANTITQPHPDLAAGAARYANDLEDLVAACQKRGLRPVLLTQPTMYRDDLPDSMANLLWASTEDGAYAVDVLAHMMESYNEATRKVATRLDLPLVDLASELPRNDAVFYDDCHFTDEGCRLVAESVARFWLGPSRASSGSEAHSRGTP